MKYVLTKGDNMKFTTKKYTRPVLVSEIKKLNNDAFTSATALAYALSPRVGNKGAKFAALRRAVNLNSVFAGNYSGSTKQFLIKMLKAN